MAGKLLAHLRQQWMGAIALLLVLTGGTAYALDGSNTVFTDDIVNGEVKVADVGQGAVATDEIANGQVKTADIGAGEVRSSDVLNDSLIGDDVASNSLKGADIDEATLDIGDTARAYARVTYPCSGADATCPFDRSKGISRVEKFGAGFYCVYAPGIDPTQTPAVVSVDRGATAAPEGNASAFVSSDPVCDGGGFPVYTYSGPNVVVTDTMGVARPVPHAPTLDDEVSFTIVIP